MVEASLHDNETGCIGLHVTVGDKRKCPAKKKAKLDFFLC